MTNSLPSSSPNPRLPVYPALGILGTAIGTLAAIEILPQDIEPAGALLGSALVMCAGSIFAPALATLQRPRAFFRAENLLATCPVYWLLLDLIQGNYSLWGLERDNVITALLAIGLFSGSIWLGSFGRPWRPPGFVRRSAELYLDPKIIYRLAIVFFVLGFCRYAIPAKFDLPLMFASLQKSRFATPWASTFISGGLLRSVIDHLVYFGYLLPTLTTLLALRKGWGNRMTVVSGFLTLTLSVFVAHGGNRRIIGVMFGAAILVWVLEQARIDLRRMVILVVLGVAMLNLLEFMLNYRSQGIELFDEQIDNDHVIVLEDNVIDIRRSGNSDPLIRVDDNFLRLTQTIQIFESIEASNGGRYPFLAGRPIIFALSRPIPRALWPGKPTSPGIDLGSIVGLGASLSSSVVSDWYQVAGMYGVFFGGLFFGRLASMASYILRRARPGSTSALTYSLMAMAMFAGYRQLIDLVLMSYLSFIWAVITYFFVRRAPEEAGAIASQSPDTDRLASEPDPNSLPPHA